MIIDLHVHPFCKEATVTPSLGEAVRRMFFGATPEQKSLEEYAALGRAFFHNRSLDDIIDDNQKSHPDSDARLGHPMLVEPVTLRYPDLKIVLGHCGFPWPWEAWSLVARRPNVYLDISAYAKLYDHLPWDAYSKFEVEHKVLFATDYPLFGFRETRDALDRVDIPESFRRKILGENAMPLLGL